MFDLFEITRVQGQEKGVRSLKMTKFDKYADKVLWHDILEYNILARIITL